jgi:hypothetical protein
MYNVIIFGTGSTSDIVVKSLNEKCKIIAFLDNNSEMWGTKDGICVESPENVMKLEYDFIVIASQYNDSIYNQLVELNINKEKILQFYRIMDSENNYVRNQIQIFEESNKNYEMLATGISYCNLGLREDIIEKRCIKFAFGSQDLYYDYNVINYLFDKFNDKCKKIKYCLIGLSYYSFQYDMSLSSMKDKVILYYETIGLVHNNPAVLKSYEGYLNSKKIADKIFEIREDGKYLIKYKTTVFPKYEEREEIGRIQAQRDCNKNYPQTVEENIEIFKSYLELLKNNNIKPIVVVFPVTKYYRNYFSNIITEEFVNIINEFKNYYKFQYIDYFNCSELLDDCDFIDVSHLNYIGAEKFSKILNKTIKW